MEIKTFLKKKLWFLVMLRSCLKYIYTSYIKVVRPSIYGHIDKNTIIEPPIILTDPKLVYLDACKIRQGFLLINYTGKFTVKKYTTIASNCTVVTGNHRKTVGVPQIISGANHINDIETDITIEEDVWIGINCTLLAGTHIGRGAIVGACSLVNKEIPPYAVVAGVPAKIIASVFSIDQIIEHEKLLYPENERFSREYLNKLFDQYYIGQKSIGTDTISDNDLLKIESFKKKLHLDI